VRISVAIALVSFWASFVFAAQMTCKKDLENIVHSAERSLNFSASDHIAQEHPDLIQSPLALEKMWAIDEFVRSRGVAELGGYGLVKNNGTKNEVIDFVAPRPERIFEVEGLFLDRYKSAFLPAFAHSKKIQLALENGQLALICDNEKRSFVFAKLGSEDLGWKSLQKYLTQLSIHISPDRETTIEWIKKHGPITLNNDYDAVISGGAVYITQYYADFVDEESKRLKAVPRFSMHHHPVHALMEMAMEDKPLAEKEQIYSNLLQPSDSDLHYMEKTDVDWFEIRAVGKPSDAHAPTTTSKFYRMGEIKKLRDRLVLVMTGFNEDLPKQELARRTYEVAQILDEVILLNLHPTAFTRYALRPSFPDLFDPRFDHEAPKSSVDEIVYEVVASPEQTKQIRLLAKQFAERPE
jgi:hypothetical protein